jgi:hypothetical protein
MERVGWASTYHDLVAVRVEVVSDVLGKRPLLVTPIRLPVRTPLVPHLGRTLAPRLQHVKRMRQVLHDDEARVEDLHTLAVLADDLAVVAALLDVPRQCNRRARGNIPLVEQPLEGDFKMRHGNVGVERDDKVVVFEQRGENVRADPGVVVAVHVLGLVVLVVVAMDLRCCLISHVLRAFPPNTELGPCHSPYR